MLTIFTRSLVCSLIHSYVHSYVHSFTVRSLVCLIVHRMFARSHSRSSYVHIHVHRMFTFTFTACLRCSQCVSVFKSFQYCLLFTFDYQIWAENSWQTKSRARARSARARDLVCQEFSAQIFLPASSAVSRQPRRSAKRKIKIFLLADQQGCSWAKNPVLALLAQ